MENSQTTEKSLLQQELELQAKEITNTKFRKNLIKQLERYEIYGFEDYKMENTESFLTEKSFSKYFLTAIRDQNRGFEIDFPSKLFSGQSEYYGGERREYKGNFDVNFARKLLSFISKHPTLLTEKFTQLEAIIGEEAITKAIGSQESEYKIRFMSESEYKDGLPLFLGETLKICQTVGKSGGKYALDSLLNRNVHNILITKKVKDGKQEKEIIVGSSILWFSQNKAVICSLETNGISVAITKPLLQKFACTLYTLLKKQNPDFDCVEIGLGGGTLKNLGFSQYTDGKDNTFFDQVRAETISEPDLEKMCQELKQQGKGMELKDILFTPDWTDPVMLGDIIDHSRDSRYRMKIVDASNIEALSQYSKDLLITETKKVNPLYTYLQRTNNPCLDFFAGKSERLY